ncbi:hypothetical protein [Sanguibacter massiliensis]|uniref:hypothetical protein n=1 Tax=Sanguibacter massiliensis TaxID=1973217 RepID=UPI000C818933|nr:hypothetical protein [Sanguibacter massiliensis]
MTLNAACTHPRARHQHGTYACYQRDECRCEPCRTAANRRAKTARVRAETGQSALVPADRTRAHLATLMDTLTMGQIARRSGIHPTALHLILGTPDGRRSKRVARKTERAVLAVRANRHGPERGGLVDSLGTQRRLRALVAMGWTARSLTARLGFSSRTTHLLLHGSRIEVLVSTRDRVRDLCAELSRRTPPAGRHATRARNVARAHGWHGIGAWDDIDDPTETPDVGVKERGLDLDEWMHLVLGGETPEQAARRCRSSSWDVQQAAREQGRPDVLRAIAEYTLRTSTHGTSIHHAELLLAEIKDAA